MNQMIRKTININHFLNFAQEELKKNRTKLKRLEQEEKKVIGQITAAKLKSNIETMRF